MEFSQYDDNNNLSLTKFESMLKTNNVLFFDSNEFENIIHHENSGLIFLGDTIGFSEANGSSGLYFGMAQADFWVRLIMGQKELDKDIRSKPFVNEARDKYNKWSVYKYIKKSYKDIVLAEKIMFNYCGSDRSLNRWWKPLMALLQLKS